MAKAPTRKLKAFQAQFGFYDTVVAAPSQAAALRAWGTRQNLFASGQAKVTDDAQAVRAALANPGIPLKRAVGSHDAFALEAAHLPDVPDAPKKAASPKKAGKATPKAPAKSPVDRTGLGAAEEAVRSLDEARKREEADFRRRQDELDTKREVAQVAYVDGRKAAAQAAVDARQKYRKAGGED